MSTFTSPFGPDNFGKVCERYKIRLKFSQEDNNLFYKFIGLLPYKREIKRDSREVKFVAFIIFLKTFFQKIKLEKIQAIENRYFEKYSQKHAEFLEIKNNPRIVCMLEEFKIANAEFKF